MLRRREVGRIARGLYRRTSAPITELETVLIVCKRVPRAIVCLLTALYLHGIGTQLPRQIWIALDNKARKPKIVGLPIRIVRFSGAMLTHAIDRKVVQNVEFRITSPARTVVDCFRYRNKTGLDVALEALRDTLRLRLASIDEIWRVAEACRVQTVIRPYLEAVTA